MNKLYYAETEVKLVRNFYFGGKMKSEIKFPNGNTAIVDRIELTEEPNHGRKNIPISSLTNIDEQQEYKEINQEQNDLVGNSNQDLDHERQGFPSYIVVTKVSNNKSENIDLNSHDFEDFISKNKLDPEAIQLCLSGEQKTHKGFRFSYPTKA